MILHVIVSIATNGLLWSRSIVTDGVSVYGQALYSMVRLAHTGLARSLKNLLQIT